MPFSVLQGEGVEYLGRADEAIIAMSNYRLHIKFKDSVINVSAAQRYTAFPRGPQRYGYSLYCNSVQLHHHTTEANGRTDGAITFLVWSHTVFYRSPN